jgi:hypothetical protein
VVNNDHTFFVKNEDTELSSRSAIPPKINLPRIIGVSGKAGSGKDEFARILNELTGQRYTVVKFATVIKKFVALILGVDVKKLEDREFKNKVLGPEWDRWVVYDKRHTVHSHPLKIFGAHEEHPVDAVFERLTPRKIMLLVGTEAGRDIIHPDIWVNALWAPYKEKQTLYYLRVSSGDKTIEEEFLSKEHFLEYHKMMTEFPEDFSEKRKTLDGEIIWEDHVVSEEVENYWIVTDVRFPNEFDSVEDRFGLNVRINRDSTEKIDHPSETSLDDYFFEETIDNNGSMNKFYKAVLVQIINKSIEK